MNKKIFLPLIVLVIPFFLWAAASGDQLPQTVTDTLKHREQRLGHSAFSWSLAVKEQDFGVVPQQTQSMQVSLEKHWEDVYRKQGMTDEKMIHESAQTITGRLLKMMQGGAVNYSNVWHFDRDGQQTLVKGTTQSIIGGVDDYSHLYDGTAMLLVHDQSRIAGGGPVSPEDPSVWRFPGESVRYSISQPLGLQLTPEHLTVLTGLTPLEMRGLDWKVLSATTGEWLLEAKTNDRQHDAEPLTVDMTLDRKHDNVPTKIRVKHYRWSEEFRSENLRRYQGEWITDKAVYTKEVPQSVSIQQTWTLQSTAPVKPIVVKMQRARLVHDYRLLKGEVNFKRVMSAEMQHNRDIVYYPWSGHIPGAEDLKALYKRQHPGEATPDPKSSASLPFAGGLLCLVGGVWMFKRRGVS